MDDKPAIEYHPFGTITLNFDDGPVKLRRCRLGDLQYAKDLLEELRIDLDPQRQAIVDQIGGFRQRFNEMVASIGERPQTEEETAEVRTKTAQVQTLTEQLDQLRADFTYRWLSSVATRMGDTPTPPMEEWPVELLLDQTLAGDVIGHWQTRPLASGKTLGQNRTTPAAANSGPYHPEASSPPEPQPQ